MRTAAPAAPRMVLWESTVNFQSSTPQGRRRPTAVVMPRTHVDVEARLGTVGGFEIDDGAFGGAGQFQLLGLGCDSYSKQR